MARYECKYCDTGFPTMFEGDRICGGCGAEWEDCKTLIEDEEE